MYATPTLAPLDLVAAAASCCRVIVSTDRQSIQIVNEPLCPFPAPTPDVCVSSTGSPLTPNLVACVLAS